MSGVSPDGVIAEYAAELSDTISITGVRELVSYSAANVRCRITGYSAQEIVGLIQQGDQKLIVLKQDLDDRSFPAPLQKGDKITTSDSRLLTVQSGNMNTRRVDETIIAYEVAARGR